jgi:probable F420-dependent oxidoreductase
MKFTTSIAMVDPSFMVPLAVAAEEAGFDTIVLPDSICYPEQSDSPYPYSPDGTRYFLENKPFIDPLIAVAAMAAATERIEFCTGVLKLPIRHPVLFAKEVTSVAVMSGNRFHLGVGTSPWPDDYDVVELPWAGRGRRFEECIEIVRGLATGDYYGFSGEFYEFEPVKLNPAPTEPVPILIGGHADINVKRAAELCDGWMPAGMAEDQLREIIGRLGRLREEAGRSHLPFQIHATTMDSFTVDGIGRLEELGVTHTGGGFGNFNPYQMEPDTEPLQDKIDAIHRHGENVIAKFRA